MSAAIAMLAVGVTGWARAGSGPGAEVVTGGRGAALFAAACASCHGFDLEGVAHRGPALRGVGAQAADFYLQTGRMPLDQPREQPMRNRPAFGQADIEALVAYVAARGGPPVPAVNPGAGTVAEGRALFTDRCAGCHQIDARGGIVTGGVAPPLQQASAQQVAEAIRIGPYLMPRFSAATIDQHGLDSLAAYVLSTRRLDDRGGIGIGHLGPIPEGMVAWLVAMVALLGISRLIGERTEPRR